jgi:hypothetical protein
MPKTSTVSEGNNQKMSNSLACSKLPPKMESEILIRYIGELLGRVWVDQNNKPSPINLMQMAKRCKTRTA